MSYSSFTIIGENIHTTRVLRTDGKRVTKDEKGGEFVNYRDINGEISFMQIPDSFKETQVYQQGRVKHFMIAVTLGMSGSPEERTQGESYILSEIKRQESKGSDFLDLNVDEISYKIDIQKSAIAWLLEFYSAKAKVPPSIDSSSAEIIEFGLGTYKQLGSPQGSPMVNSASLERVSVLDLVAATDSSVIVTAAGSDAMPSEVSDRVSNVSHMIEECFKRGIDRSKIYVDALVFPISVDQNFGNHYLESVTEIRREFGNEIHITGGLSNVSFGLPLRRLINDTFIRLSIEAGVDSAILNPVESDLERIFDLDMESERVQTAINMLTGKDEYCMDFLGKYREGRLFGS
ncbi:MAG: dihydropteroate synthase [Chloroflexota bacterium]|nr:dihydropteroate synthase [Chloroflexota bacterium]